MVAIFNNPTKQIKFHAKNFFLVFKNYLNGYLFHKLSSLKILRYKVIHKAPHIHIKLGVQRPSFCPKNGDEMRTSVGKQGSKLVLSSTLVLRGVSSPVSNSHDQCAFTLDKGAFHTWC
jgi:hypothetical protein